MYVFEINVVKVNYEGIQQLYADPIALPTQTKNTKNFEEPINDPCSTGLDVLEAIFENISILCRNIFV